MNNKKEQTKKDDQTIKDELLELCNKLVDDEEIKWKRIEQPVSFSFETNYKGYLFSISVNMGFSNGIKSYAQTMYFIKISDAEIAVEWEDEKIQDMHELLCSRAEVEEAEKRNENLTRILRGLTSELGEQDEQKSLFCRRKPFRGDSANKSLL